MKIRFDSAPTTVVRRLTISLLLAVFLFGCSSNDPIQSSGPIIGVTPPSLNFSTPFGLASAQDSIIIVNAGTGSLVFNASTTASWLRIEGQLTDRIFVRVFSAGLPIGETSDVIRIEANGASNSPMLYPVTVSVLERFSLTNSLVSFASLTADTNPDAKFITISASGGSALDYTATWNSSWLSVSPSSGTTPQQISISVDISSLPGGLLTDTIAISSTQFPELSKSLVVTLSLSSWTIANVSMAPDLQGIMFEQGSSLNGWAAAFLGGGAGPTGAIVKTNDGGLNWNINLQWPEGGLGDIYFIDADTGIAVGDSATIIRTTNAGADWSAIPRQALGIDSTIDLWRVLFVDDTTGFAIGTIGTILRTADAGQSWTQQQSGSSFSLSAISFAGTNLGWIVGNAGTVLHSSNGGLTWGMQNTPNGTDLWGVSFYDALNGWIVGSNGVMLSTSDGGISWEFFNSGINVRLRNISFIDAINGWAVGADGTVIHTGDGGLTWVLQKTGTTEDLFGLFFIDQNVGFVTGTSGTLLKTINGGF